MKQVANIRLIQVYFKNDLKGKVRIKRKAVSSDCWTGQCFAKAKFSSTLCLLETYYSVLDVNHFYSFQIHGGADHGGGVADSVGHFLAFLESLAKQEPSDLLANIFPGIAELDNIHPLLVHFPIAFLIGFFILDLLGTLIRNPVWRRAASAMLYFGTIGAAITVFTGLQAAETVMHGGNVHDIMERHEQIGITVLSLSVLLSIWRLLAGSVLKGAANVFFLFLSGVVSVLVVLGADLGGLMVYHYGVAVEGAVDASEASAHEHGHSNTTEHSHEADHEHEHSHTIENGDEADHEHSASPHNNSDNHEHSESDHSHQH